MPWNDQFVQVIQEADNPLDAYLLSTGKLYSWRSPPAQFRQMAAKQCWDNAYHLARRTGWSYACGYACTDVALPIPIMHAWVVDPEGYVLDLTWTGVQRGQFMDVDYSAETSRRYFGIELPLELVARYSRKEAPLTILEQHLRAQFPHRQRGSSGVPAPQGWSAADALALKMG